MNIGKFLKFDRNKFNPNDFRKKCYDCWSNHYRVAFAIFSLAILAFGGYFWYQNLYRSDWSSEKKENYKNLQNENTGIKEQEFKEVIREIERKKAVYDKPAEFAKDVFLPYPGDKKSD